MARDSSFDRLNQAWQAGRVAKMIDFARRSLDSLARHAGVTPPADRDGVLWIRANPARYTIPPAVTSLVESRRNFRITCVTPRADEDLHTLLQRHNPRLLVADVAWCAAIGEMAIKRLHRHAPHVDWLLSWDEPSPQWLETLVHSGARGAVTRTAGQTDLARAFDAVDAGEIWLPRRVLQWLYATLTDASLQDANSTLPSSLWPNNSQFTPREAEVVDLLRHGLTNREIGQRLGVSINTVKKHVASAYEKRGIRSRRQTIA
ncbi:MAG TPA: response regulator transcription factor [Burkholderiaceae bacterium]|nr:response regulator transcription factor [Burkholderiaceae bacterium]